MQCDLCGQLITFRKVEGEGAIDDWLAAKTGPLYKSDNTPDSRLQLDRASKGNTVCNAAVVGTGSMTKDDSVFKKEASASQHSPTYNGMQLKDLDDVHLVLPDELANWSPKPPEDRSQLDTSTQMQEVMYEALSAVADTNGWLQEDNVQRMYKEVLRLVAAPYRPPLFRDVKHKLLVSMAGVDIHGVRCNTKRFLRCEPDEWPVVFDKQHIWNPWWFSQAQATNSQTAETAGFADREEGMHVDDSHDDADMQSLGKTDSEDSDKAPTRAEGNRTAQAGEDNPPNCDNNMQWIPGPMMKKEQQNNFAQDTKAPRNCIPDLVLHAEGYCIRFTVELKAYVPEFKARFRSAVAQACVQAATALDLLYRGLQPSGQQKGPLDLTEMPAEPNKEAFVWFCVGVGPLAAMYVMRYVEVKGGGFTREVSLDSSFNLLHACDVERFVLALLNVCVLPTINLPHFCGTMITDDPFWAGNCSDVHQPDENKCILRCRDGNEAFIIEDRFVKLISDQDRAFQQLQSAKLAQYNITLPLWNAFYHPPFHYGFTYPVAERLQKLTRSQVDQLRAKLDALHKLGIAHMDIALRNAVFYRNEAYWIDFEVARWPASGADIQADWQAFDNMVSDVLA
eukprot:NODE_237_length_2238_cov_41.995263_g231_i0.p1 GENE.NODE_237_length_2238_cov_41.995263_g231_i0~~NODE_237_length_2238_cov_41.995263_g231_i0.p1  ORF type:complete len:680 (+),score=115.96 NODE_237_length_2238_cov_41.995263_g231_i0:179-2041(+)